MVLVAGFAVPLPTDGAPASVMAVQGNVPRAGLDFNAERRQVLDNHVTATEDAAAEVAAGTRPKPDLVVWPENASDIDPTRNADAQDEILRAVDALGAPLVVGTLLEQPAPDISNVALLYEPGKGITQTYVKQHPVPFAEYIPNRDFFRRFSDKVDLVRADFAAGTGPVLFRVPAAAGGEVVAGPTICFEVAYDDLVRANVDLGANLLAGPDQQRDVRLHRRVGPAARHLPDPGHGARPVGRPRLHRRGERPHHARTEPCTSRARCSPGRSCPAQLPAAERRGRSRRWWGPGRSMRPVWRSWSSSWSGSAGGRPNPPPAYRPTHPVEREPHRG